MKRFIIHTIIGAMLVSLYFMLSFSAEEELMISFDTFRNRIEAAPKMLTVDDTRKQLNESLITKDDFQKAHRAFLATLETESSQAHTKNWLNEKNDSSLFATKISVDPDAALIFHGDMHGDIHSLMMLLRILQASGYMRQDDGFAIKDAYKDSFYMVFLGDYVDRGWYGVEVLYALMRLKIANPDNVFLLRGNHEDPFINIRYGFLTELTAKSFSEDVLEIYKLYNYLPSALYLSVKGSSGKDILQCNHGGLELGFDPKPLLAAQQKHAFQWINLLDRAPMLTGVPQIENYIFHGPLIRPGQEKLADYLEFTGKPDTQNLGFLWNDFIVDQTETIRFDMGRGLSSGKTVTEEILKIHSSPDAKIRGVMRAHQHSGSVTPMMRMLLQPDASEAENLGVARLWKDEINQDVPSNRLWHGIVCTFNVSPFTPYGVRQALGQFEFDTFALLLLNEKFENWDFQVHRTYPNKTGRERFPSFTQFKEATTSFMKKSKKKLEKKLLEHYTNNYETLSYELNQLVQVDK